MQKITVQLKERSYPIFVGAPLKDLGARLKKCGFGPKVFVVTNPKVGKLYFAPLERGLKQAGFSVARTLIPDGERFKTLATVESVYRAALRAGADRRTVFIALGGGVTGDIAGFAAATYMRGVPFVQVPTTLLAMVDSSVGGKTGVDLPEGKNLVGAFYQPKLVWIDTETLQTLPEREVRNGLAEVIKYGVIRDATFFRSLEKTIHGARFSPQVFGRMIARCCRIKADVVGTDEREEKGVREILNFGHTFGHAIETATGYRAYSHGEGVAVGMALAGKLARRLGGFSEKDQARLERLLGAAGLPVALRAKVPPRTLLAAMRKDKKACAGVLRFVLPRAIGTVEVRAGIEDELVQEVLR